MEPETKSNNTSGRSPSIASRNEVWKVEGVSIFPLGVFARGHGIHMDVRYELTTSDQLLAALVL